MKKYIAAVSGGSDSMAMLDVFKKKIIAVCHINYHDREDTDNDEKIVVDYCKKNNIKCFVLQLTQKMKDDTKIKNAETMYRTLRYGYICEVAMQLNNPNVLVAHNKNDFLESAYMQKQKNSMSLFYGIRNKSKYKNIIIHRPLLNKTKSWSNNYCVKNKIHFAVDYTNFMDMYYRNGIRALLNSYSKEKLLEFENEIKEYNKKNAKLEKNITKVYLEWKKLNFDVDYFKQLDESYYPYIIYMLLSTNNVATINKNKMYAVVEFILKGKPNSTYRLKDHWFISKKNNQLTFIER